MGYYLGALVSKKEELLKNTEDGKVPTYVEHLNKLFIATDAWHLQMQDGPTAGSWCILGSDEFVLTDILPTVVGRYSGNPGNIYSNDNAIVGSVDEQEQWAEMLRNLSRDLDPTSLPLTGPV